MDIRFRDEPPQKTSIISDLEDISKQRDVIFGEKPKKKQKEKNKKDKKEKKKKPKNTIEVDLIGGPPADVEIMEHDEYTEALLDVDKMFTDEIEYDEDGQIISNTIIDSERNYKKQKKNENEFRKEFAEEVTLLYDLLKDTGKLSKEIDKMLKDATGSRVRGVSKNLTELINSKSSTASTQLAIIKEINNIKAKAIDLKFKSEAKKNKEEGDQNFALVSASYLQGITKNGRQNFMQSVRGASGYLPQTSVPTEDDYTGTIIDYEGVPQVYTEDETSHIEDLIEQRLREEGNPFRSAEGDKIIEYENRGVEIKIKLYVDTGEWEFFAVDRDNILLYDYPLPRPEDAKPIKFTGHIATDRRGIQYRVMEAYSEEF